MAVEGWQARMIGSSGRAKKWRALMTDGEIGGVVGGVSLNRLGRLGGFTLWRCSRRGIPPRFVVMILKKAVDFATDGC